MTDWHYIVCDGDGYRSSDDDSENETFATLRDAKARAQRLAAAAPGTPVFVYEAIAVARVSTSPVETQYKYPGRDGA